MMKTSALTTTMKNNDEECNDDDNDGFEGNGDNDLSDLSRPAKQTQWNRRTILPETNLFRFPKYAKTKCRFWLWILGKFGKPDLLTPLL